MADFFIQKALSKHRKGALHRAIGVPEDRTIPPGKLAAFISSLQARINRLRARGESTPKDVLRKLREAVLARTLKKL